MANDGRFSRPDRPPQAYVRLSACLAFLFIVTLLAAMCLPLLADSPWYNARNGTGYNNCFSYTGSARGAIGGGWYNSGNACTWGTVRTATASDYFTLYADNTNTSTDGKALAVAGGYYDVIVYTAGSSGYQGTNIKISGQIMDSNGRIASGLNKNVWTIPSPLCTGQNIGRIRLNPGATTTQIKFYPDGATINGSANMWYFNCINLNNVAPTMYNLVLATNPSDQSWGTVTGDALYTSFCQNESVKVTANPKPGYHFLNWTTPGNQTPLSSNAVYSFAMPNTNNYTLVANFSDKYLVTANVQNPLTSPPAPAAGTISGAGLITAGTSCTLTPTVNPGYTFSKWTSDAAGANLVSTDNPYTFTVNSDVTVYAQFTVNNYTLSQAVSPAGAGTVTGSSGTEPYYTSCNETAVPNSGYDFVGWSTDGGTTIVSRIPKYTFNMPASDVTYTAVFAPQTTFAFRDGFEGYKGSGSAGASDFAQAGVLDSNASSLSVGGTTCQSNQTANGTGTNPWWGCTAYNGIVFNTHDSCTTYHVGAAGNKILSGWQGLQADNVNFAFRANGGKAVSGNFYADWWFYDYVGTAGDLTTADFKYVDDAATIGYLKNWAYNLDYVAGSTTNHYGDSDFYTKISLGCGNDVTTGWDKTVYQARIYTDAGSHYPTGLSGRYGALGWINLTGASRSVGWHHCRVVFGPVKSTGTNDLSFYVDDMAAPKLATDSFSPYVGYNLMELQEEYWAVPLANKLPYFALWDDVNVASTPGIASLYLTPPTNVPPGSSTVATFDGVGADHFMLQIDGGTWSTQTSPYTVNTTGMAYGNHTVSVKPVDAGGREGVAVTATFRVDSIITGLTATPTPTTPGTPVTVSWSASGMDHFMAKLDSGTYTQMTSPWIIDTTTLAYGTHTVSVKGVDASGNDGTVASVNFILDRSIVDWSIIGHYPAGGTGTGAGNARFNLNCFDPAITEDIVGAKTNLGYPTSTLQPTPQGTGTANATWQPYHSPTPNIDLNVVYGTPTTPFTQYGDSYLCTYVLNAGPAVTNCYFACGSDDGNKIYVNGVAQTLVSSIGNTDHGTIGHDVYRGVVWNQDLYGPFTLKAGGNKILAKVTQGTSGYGFEGELCNVDRTELANVAAGQITYAVSDDTPPTGTLAINGGAATATSFNVTLTLTATDDLNPVTQMSFSNDGFTWSAPIPFATSAPWVLSDNAGPKTVYAKLIDSCGNEGIISDDILVPTGWTVMLFACGDTPMGAPTGGGIYPNNSSVTVSANPLMGYTFVGWSDINTGCSDPGPFVSRSANYTFTIKGDQYLFANYAIGSYPVTATACTGGTTTGSATYQYNTSVTVTATPDATHEFVNWTTDSCGGTAVASTSASYTFTQPGNPVTLFANFAPTNVLTVNVVPSAGGTVTGAGRHATGDIVPLVATPNTGYTFACWTSDAAGLNVVNVDPTFNYTMPATDTTLYAQFAVSHVFADDFEGRTVDAQLDFQGWWQNDMTISDYAPDYMVRSSGNGITPHSGSKCVIPGAILEQDGNLIDLAYHGGNGFAITRPLQADWWFYDPNGTTNPLGYQDWFVLSNIGNMPGDKEPTGTSAGYTPWVQRLSVGGYSGGDNTKYQIRIIGHTTADTVQPKPYNDQGWFNAPVTRSVGWHHGTILVGPQQPNNLQTVEVYIDGTLCLTSDSGVAGGFNFFTLVHPNLGTGVTGANMGAFDDITVTTGEWPEVKGLTVTPNQVVGPAATATWTANYADHSLIQVDGGSWVDPVSSPYTLDCSNFTYNSTHTVAVKCVDAFGRVSTTATASFTVNHSSIRTWNVMGHFLFDYSIGVGSGRWAHDFFTPLTSEDQVCAKTGVSYDNGLSQPVPQPRTAWTPYTSPTPLVDFNVIYGTPNPNTEWGVSYLFVYVVNSGPAIPNAFLSLGTDDGCKVWWNGVYQGGNDIYRGCTIDKDIYPATGGFTINPGGNRLLIKVTQGSTGYQAIGRLCAYDGTNRTDPAWLSQLSYVVSDDTPPTGTISGPATSSSVNVTLTLAATDDLSGVAKMQFSNDGAIYGAPVAYNTSYAYTLPNSSGANTVYVKFIDGAGNVSAPASATITVSSGPQPPPACTEKVKISDLWPLANDATVYGLDNTNAKTVTAVWSDGFWIEETNRYAGIKVLVPGGAYKYFDDGTKSAVQVGDVVDVYGNLSVAAGSDRVFNASYVRDRTVGAGTAIKALGVTQRYIVGKQASANTPGLASGKGIYSAGLFVKLAGAVLNPGANSFFLDDKTYAAGTGIQVFCGTLSVPTSGNKVVTGVVGMAGGLPVIYATSIQ